MPLDNEDIILLSFRHSHDKKHKKHKKHKGAPSAQNDGTL